MSKAKVEEGGRGNPLIQHNQLTMAPKSQFGGG